MGDFRIKKIENEGQRNQFYNQILKDLEAFDFMLLNDLIDTGSSTIGVEQEIVLIDEMGDPYPKGVEILADINDEHFTSEIARFNLEANLDPLQLENDCFSRMENDLTGLLTLGNAVANRHGGSFYLTGVLPTIVRGHLDFGYMTPVDRYQVLSEELRGIRQADFQVHLQGVDDLQMNMASILFEACNTSFQMHLQINPQEFVAQHNWSQMIAGAVLAGATNAPILFGRELWHENRIAIFKQSLDTRNYNSHYREKAARVSFGRNWLEGSPSDLWKNDVARFPLVFRGSETPDPMRQINEGIMPELRSVRLHSGTTYTWNRLCYGLHKNVAHIRIECRYLPAGPSAVDEVANMVFWVGLMKAMPKEPFFWRNEDFRAYKENFFKAARYGLHNVLYWKGKRVPAKLLILDELIPMARKALIEEGVSTIDIDKYLGIIANRVSGENTGSDWSIRNFRKLLSTFKPALACRILVQESLNFQRENLPVSSWSDITKTDLSHYFTKHFDDLTVADIMSTEILTIHGNANLQTARSIMEWRNIHHLIVEGEDQTCLKLLSANLLLQDYDETTILNDLELFEPLVVGPETGILHAKALMFEKGQDSIAVCEAGKVVGILTSKDF